MRHSLCLLALLGALILGCLPGVAQVNIPFPDEENLRLVRDGYFSTPGVRNGTAGRGIEISQELSGGFDWEPVDEELDSPERRVRLLQNLVIKFKAPIVNQDQFKLLFGYEWNREEYKLEPALEGAPRDIWSALDDHHLKTNKFSLYAVRSWNSRFYSTAVLRMSVNGDYAGWMDFGDHYRTYSALLAFGVKPNEDREWGFGLTFSHNDVRNIILPFFIFNRTFNDRWGLQSVLPAELYLRRNFGPTTTLLIGAEYDSKFYALNWRTIPAPYLEGYYLRNGGVRVKAHLEQQVIPWIWIYGDAGVWLPLNSEFNLQSNVDVTLKAEPASRPFVQVGIFLSPPKDKY